MSASATAYVHTGVVPSRAKRSAMSPQISWPQSIMRWRAERCYLGSRGVGSIIARSG
jgi:hypothetical protein